MRSLVRLACVMAALNGVGCNAPTTPGPSVGSNSNWLHRCEADDQCGETSACRCGVCTLECSDDRQCDALGTDHDHEAHCALSSETPLVAGCPAGSLAGTSRGLCLPRCEPGGCDADFACVLDTCVPLALPVSTFCDPVHERSLAERQREEQLLALLEQKRVAGQLSCVTTPQAALRLDARLTCAARVLAVDMNASKAHDLLDTQGRSSTKRMQLAGYAPRAWGESFAIFGASADAALGLMLQDVDTCARFGDARYQDIGIGSAGDVQIVTIGSQ